MNYTSFFLSVFFTISTLFALGQTEFPLNSEGNAEYTEVVEVADADAAELYDRANLWINEFFNNPSKTVEESKEGESISGNARFRLNTRDRKGSVMPNGGFVNYRFELLFKDGRYKYRIYRIRWEAPSYFDVAKWLDTSDPDYEESTYTYNIEQTKIYMDNLIKSMTTAMAQAQEEESSDW